MTRRFLLLPLLLGLALAVPATLAALARAQPPSPEAPPVAAPPAVPGAPGAPSEEERAAVRRMVDELRAEAAKVRGLAWKHDVPADLLSREQLRANLERMVAEEMKPEELARDTAILRRLGLLGPDEDPLAMMLEMSQEIIAGYYNPKEKHFFLIEGMVGDSQKPVILHELIHALEDQYIDLETRAKQWEEDPDRLFAEQCLGEGSAEQARMLYQQAHPDIDRAYAEGQQDQAAMQRQMAVIMKVPAWMLVGTLLHYDVGPKLVGRAVGDDYPGGMVRLWQDPPVSQEQFLHPDRWLGQRQDFPLDVAWSEDLAAKAGEGWAKLHELTAGELDLVLYLDFFLSATKGKLNPFLLMQGKYYADAAAAAGAGWDGGRSLWIQKEGKIAWVQAYAFDTEPDAGEAFDALLAALRKANGETLAAEAPRRDASGAVQVDYAGRHGRGRLAQLGTRVLLLDGVEAETLDRLWPAVLATEFRKHERDTWDPSNLPDPFAACDLVDREKGIGAVLPEGWVPVDHPDPRAVLAFAKDEVVGSIVHQPSPVGLAMLRSVLEQQLKAQFPSFDPATREDVAVGASRGVRYRLGAMAGDATGQQVVLYVGDAPRALVILRFAGTAEALAARQADMDRIAKDLVAAAP